MLILSTPSFADSNDKGSWFWGFSIGFMRWCFPWPYAEVVQIGTYVTEVCADGEMERTLFRVGQLRDGNEGEIRGVYLGTGQDKLSVTRAGVAGWVLKEIGNRVWVNKAPYVCNA